jgi:hypothetical protein
MNHKTQIIRKKSADNYTIIHNEILQRTDISWKAKGILVYILSLPDDWVIYLEEVMEHATDGRDSFRAGWNELRNKGYVKRYPIKEKGKIIRWNTEVYESVEVNKKFSNTKQEVKPLTGFPLMENPTLLNTYYTKNLNIDRYNKNNIYTYIGGTFEIEVSKTKGK